MTRKIANKTLFVVFLGVLITLLTVFLIPITMVQIKQDSFTCYFKENSFELSWIHSIEKEEWAERYIINKDAFNLIESRFKTFGAGVPNDGNIIKNEDGFIAFKTDMEFKSINWIISNNVKSTLKFQNKTFEVYKYFKDYSELVFSIEKKTPLLIYFKKDLCYDKLSGQLAK